MSLVDDENELDYDDWEGQFEFLGPTPPSQQISDKNLVLSDSVIYKHVPLIKQSDVVPDLLVSPKKDVRSHLQTQNSG